MQNILAAADANVIGKVLEEGKYCMHVKESFYKGEKISEKELAVKLNEFESVNLIGEKCVNIALKEGIASEKSIVKISGVPHLQIYKI